MALEKLTAEIPDMDPSCRVSVLMPAFLEQEHIFHAIQGFATQVNLSGTESLDPSFYEIIALVNTETGIDHDGTLQEAMRAKEAYPETNIHILHHEFPAGRRGVGHTRKILADLAVTRSKRRTQKDGELLIQSTDADLIKVDKKLIAAHAKAMDENPGFVGVVGNCYLDPELLHDIDVLLLKTRIKSTIQRLLGTRLNGANSMFRASAYSHVGGYDPTLTKSEDTDLSRRLEYAQLGVIGATESLVISPARRFIPPLIKNNMNPSYENFGDAQHEIEIRNFTREQILKELEWCSVLDESNIKTIEFYLNIFLKKCLSAILDRKKAIKTFSEMMHRSGFKSEDYTIKDDAIEITSIKNIKNALAEYKKENKYRKWLEDQEKLSNLLLPQA